MRKRRTAGRGPRGSAGYQEVNYPASRIGTIDLGRIGGRKHHVAGLLEVDVTDLLARVRRMRSEGIEVSFFTWMVKEIGDAISDNRYMHALSGKKNTTVIFEDVDISIVVEREVDGVRVPLPLIIRKANEKTAADIHGEIRDAQRQEIRDEGDYVLAENSQSRRMMKLYYASSQWLRLLVFRQILRNPFRAKEMMGTVMITSVGTAGHLPGWILPRAMHNLCFALGSIVKKPWVVKGEIQIRDILHLTMLFDHDVVDGVPAMRFASRLVARLQAGAAEPREPA